MPMEHAAYLAKLDYIASTKKDLSPSTAPRHDDPLSRHRLSYLSGGGGGGGGLQRQNHASDRALPPEQSPCLHPDPSPGQRDAGPGRPGPDLPQLLPLE